MSAQSDRSAVSYTQVPGFLNISRKRSAFFKKNVGDKNVSKLNSHDKNDKTIFFQTHYYCLD